MTESELNEILKLSEREYDVFIAMGKGMTTMEISRISGHVCSHKSIETHQAGIKMKLGHRNLCQTRAFATRFLVHCETYGIERRMLITGPIRYEFVNKLAA